MIDPQQINQSQHNPQCASMNGGKEGEPVSVQSSELPLKPVSQEIELPKEVVSAGVQVIPQATSVPPQIAQAGVQAVGHHAPVNIQSSSVIHLPLTDEQIAKALHESIADSIRWLAEWCVRQIHIVHAKVLRKHADHA